MPTLNPSISAIVITKNEAQQLRECLASVAWCDEIVVVDARSADDTVNVARNFGARVEITDNWPGFGAQKNRALALATCEWVLSIDADERVDPVGVDEIRKAIADSQFDGFEIPRRSLFVARYMQHSGWWPDAVLRVARRDRARFTNAAVHERMEVDGRVSRLTTPLDHLSYRSFESVLTKQNAYSTAGARELYDRGVRGSIASALVHGLAMFVRTYIVKRGFLDGRYGFLLAVSNAQTSFWKYIKLAEIDRTR